jgi:hypothetical protein
MLVINSKRQKNKDTTAKRKNILRKTAFLRGCGGFGMNELLGIAAALILAAFVVIPGLRNFAGDVIEGLTGWWEGPIMSKIFPSSI